MEATILGTMVLVMGVWCMRKVHALEYRIRRIELVQRQKAREEQRYDY